MHQIKITHDYYTKNIQTPGDSIFVDYWNNKFYYSLDLYYKKDERCQPDHNIDLFLDDSIEHLLTDENDEIEYKKVENAFWSFKFIDEKILSLS